LVPIVESRPQARLFQRPERIPGVAAPARLDAGHDDLLGSEPGRNAAAVVLEEDAEKALQAPDQRSVEDDRLLPAARSVGEGQLEPPGQHQVDLDRPALPGASQAVAEHELQLGPIERALSGLLAPDETGGPGRIGQERLRPVPDRVVSQSPRRTSGEGDLEIFEPEGGIQRPDAPDETPELVPDLLLAAEHVPIVLGELTETEQAVQRSGRLVPVHEAELGDSQWQIGPPGAHSPDELHVAGTADRLQRPGLSLDDQHPLAEDAPVAAALPHRLGEHLGTSHLPVALMEDDAPELFLERTEELQPARVPEDTSS